MNYKLHGLIIWQVLDLTFNFGPVLVCLGCYKQTNKQTHRLCALNTNIYFPSFKGWKVQDQGSSRV